MTQTTKASVYILAVLLSMSPAACAGETHIAIPTTTGKSTYVTIKSDKLSIQAYKFQRKAKNSQVATTENVIVLSGVWQIIAESGNKQLVELGAQEGEVELTTTLEEVQLKMPNTWDFPNERSEKFREFLKALPEVSRVRGVWYESAGSSAKDYIFLYDRLRETFKYRKVTTAWKQKVPAENFLFSNVDSDEKAVQVLLHIMSNQGVKLNHSPRIDASIKVKAVP